MDSDTDIDIHIDILLVLLFWLIPNYYRAHLRILPTIGCLECSTILQESPESELEDPSLRLGAATRSIIFLGKSLNLSKHHLSHLFYSSGTYIANFEHQMRKINMKVSCIL